MISIITTGRDDNYGENFIQNMQLSIQNTISCFENENIEYEVIIVDWSPLGKKLKENSLLQEIAQNPRVFFTVVDGEAISKKGLNPKNFYEYFAKNVGVRKSKYEWLLLQNPDIMLSNGIAREISNVIRTSTTLEKTFYRFNLRIRTNFQNAKSGAWMNIKPSNLLNPKNRDNHVLGGFGGDILFVSKNIFSDFGKGYDESCTGHKNFNLRQSCMDSEILLNMHKNGASMQLIQEVYAHIEHKHPYRRDGFWTFTGYENIENWGFWDIES